MSLYEQIGGRAAIDAAVELFYKKVLGDSGLKGFFSNTEMSRQRMMLKMFLYHVLGGAENYTGRNMREAHSKLDLTDAHFDAVAGHLHDTLKELSVADDLIQQIMELVATTRDDVLGRGVDRQAS